MTAAPSPRENLFQNPRVIPGNNLIQQEIIYPFAEASKGLHFPSGARTEAWLYEIQSTSLEV